MVLAFPSAAGAPGSPLQATEVRLVTGTPATLFPSASVANLDAGDLVGGNTRWDHDGDGTFFNEAFVGLLWTPADGMRVFEVADREAFESFFHIPSEIADNQYVAGTTIHRDTLLSEPFLWSPSGGLRDLPIPRNWTGSASAIAASGSTVAGEIRDGLGSNVPSQAVRWRITGNAQPHARMFQLPSGQLWPSPRDVSANGEVIVGAAGPTAAAFQATRWVSGVQQPLAAVGTTSTASFTSADGSIALGTAVIGAQTVLVRWLANGTSVVFAPTAGDSIRELDAVNPGATAAVGMLAVGGNPAPFVWTLADGFVVIPELGRELDYDLSRATDVSDDGDTVVGNYGATVVFEGDPPPLGFVWTRSGGVFVVDDLLVAGGFGDLGVFEVEAVSGDGSRILATGNPPRTSFDTNSILVTLEL